MDDKDRKIEQLESALHGVRHRGYRPAIESGEPYEHCWCFHMPEDLLEWWKPEVWEHDHRCSAARELFREWEVESAQHAKKILDAYKDK